MELDGGTTILFGGDLGRYDRPVLPDPTPVAAADVLLVESTYGDRVHEPDDDGARLARDRRETVARGGKVIIPAFAIGRVEELLYWLKRLEEEQRIPVLPVFVDSPMARRGAAVLRAARRPSSTPDMRPAAQGASPMLRHARFQTVSSPQQSAELVASRDAGGHRISASGMATGGRVLHHLERGAAGRAEHGAVRRLPGGRHARPLARGRRAEVKIHGQIVPVAARVERIDSMSAHADAGEILRWLRGFTAAPA